MKALTDAGFRVGVFLMPILPHLTDSVAAIDTALTRIAETGADHVIYGALHLRPGVKPWFLQWLQREHPELMSSYRGLYPGAASEAPKPYRKWLAARMRPMIRMHGLDVRAEEEQPMRRRPEHPRFAPTPRPAAQPAPMRGVYEELSLRVARHPSETDAYMLTRVLAYALEHAEGIDFGGTVSSTEEPAVLVRDLTGSILTWIEVGAPDAERLHFAGKAADRVAVYTHREPTRLMAGWEGKKIHGADALVVRSFDPGFLDAATAVLDRRNEATLTVTEGQLYLDLNGSSFTSALHEHRLG